MTAAAATADKLDEWAAIHAPDCSLHLEPRNPPLSAASLAEMLSRPPAMFKFDGTPDGIADHYADLPADLIADVSALARRFAALMDVARVRVRIERTDSNACRKVHVDYTDVRLIDAGEMPAGMGTRKMSKLDAAARANDQHLGIGRRIVGEQHGSHPQHVLMARHKPRWEQRGARAASACVMSASGAQ